MHNRLAPNPAGERRQLVRPSAPAVAALADLARSLHARVNEVAENLVDAINATDEVYRDSGIVSREVLYRACQDNLGEVLLALGELPEVNVDPTHSRETGRLRAEQGLPLENLLHAYRLGGRVLWEGFVAEARSRNPSPMDELMESAVLIWDQIDIYSAEVANAYRRSQAEILSRVETEKQTLLTSLLTGLTAERDLAFAAEVLGLPPSGPYLVAVADRVGTATSSATRVGAALARVGLRSEWLVREDRLVGLISMGATSERSLGEHLKSAGTPQVGLSPQVASLDQVGPAYRQAELALRTIPPGRHQVASLDDMLPGALIAASPELARRLTSRVLGPVLELPAADSAVLMSTLRAYIASGGSMSSTARRLSCHRNTVFNRISRVERLTGRRVSVPAQLVELTLALLASELLSLPGPAGVRRMAAPFGTSS